jgi:hypothetical protein
LFERIVAGGNGIDRIGLFLQTLDDETLDAGIVFCKQDAHDRIIREKRRGAGPERAVKMISRKAIQDQG